MSNRDQTPHRQDSEKQNARPNDVRLPARLALVVQLQPAPNGAALCGRIEHVDTGRAAHFADGEDLLAFLLETRRRHRNPGTGRSDRSMSVHPGRSSFHQRRDKETPQ